MIYDTASSCFSASILVVDPGFYNVTGLYYLFIAYG